MLRSIEALEKYDVQANDGPIGHVCDFLFDDESWVVRYVVVDTGGWLSGRKVLISPISIGRVDPEKKHLQVLLDREQIENSPDIDSDKPVSRWHEMRYFKYYSYPCYWGGTGLWGAGSFPSLMLCDIDGREDKSNSADQQLPRSDDSRTIEPGQPLSRRGDVSPVTLDDSAPAKRDDPHLRSCKSVLNYEIQATDGLMGHVDGFLVDEGTWAIRDLVLKASRWGVGHRVLIASDWITSVNWLERTVRVDLSRTAIKESPRLESAEDLDHEDQAGLYEHHGRSGYASNRYRGRLSG